MLNWNELQVGRRVYRPGMPECCHLDIMPFGLLFLIRVTNPTKSIIRDFTAGYVQFRTIMADDYIAFLARFGMLPWIPAFFHRSEAQVKTVPSPVAGSGLPIHCILVDAKTGILKARRLCPLQPETARKLCCLMQAQDRDAKLLNKDILLRRIAQRFSPIQLAVLAASSWKIQSEVKK